MNFMKNKRSKVLLVCAILSIAYSIYLISYFAGTVSESEETAEVIGSVLATALVMPHLIMMSLGSIFAVLGVFLRAPWSACVAGILFCVGTVLFFAYAFFSIPLVVLAFVGYAKQKKINAMPLPVGAPAEENVPSGVSE